MSKWQKNAKEEMRINLILTPEISERLEKYCLKIANKKGKIPWGIKTAIARRAIDTWLTIYEDDVDIDFDNPNTARIFKTE